MEYITIRHAQHAATEHDPLSDDLGLTLGGIDEARQIGNLIRGEKIKKAYTFNSERALSTVALSLNNKLAPGEVPASLRQYRKSRRLEVDDNFDYLPIYPGRYQDELFASFAEDKQMAFTILESVLYTYISKMTLNLRFVFYRVCLN